LDIGCGPGSQIFRERAKQVVGVDASATILQDCAKRYDVVAVARLPHLPFPDASIDAAVTSHVMGHIPFEIKEDAAAEIARIVRKGGVTAHVIETASSHPAVAAAKKKPALFQKQFIDQHGHVGLEHVDDVIARFQRHGFRLKERRLVDAMVPSALNYRIFFDVDGLRDLPEVRTTALLNAMNRNPIGNLIYEVGMGAFHLTVEQWLGHSDQAQFVMVAFERV
jgi:SAM-dependent methyltransferase